MIHSLTQIIKDNYVHFDSYRAGIFYYTVNVEDNNYRFAIDQMDIGDATMLKSDKAILYMRWIRRAIDENQFIKI